MVLSISFKMKKISLLVDVHRSKTPLLKVPTHSVNWWPWKKPKVQPRYVFNVYATKFLAPRKYLINCLKTAGIFRKRWQSECKLFEGASQTCSPRRERKQHRRRRLRKRRLKSEVALLQTLSRLFHIVQFVKCWQFFLELNSRILNRSSGEEKETRCLLFTSSTKREIMNFHVVVVQWRQRNLQKKRVGRAKLLFCRSRPIASFAVLVDVAVVVA